MLKINDKYYLDSDIYQFIIVEHSVNAVEGSKHFGKDIFTNVAYCGNLAQVRTWLFEHEIKCNLEILANIDKCLELEEQLRKINAGDLHE